MSDASTFDFGKFIPGFDFLQQLASTGSGASGPVPGLGSWVAPTVSVEELDKRVAELKAVLFWLEQNATALKATIQALEVQKMTLSALASMNLSVSEVAKAFTLPTAQTQAQPPAANAPMPTPALGWPFGPTTTAAAVSASEAVQAASPAAAEEMVAESEAQPEPEPAKRAAGKRAAAKPAATAPAATPAGGLADPMQWWGALTQQFQQIATKALHEAARVAPMVGIQSGAPDAEVQDAGPPAAPARKPAAKKRAAKKTPAKAAKKAPAKRARKAAPAKPAPAAKSVTGWPLPPPFKLGR